MLSGMATKVAATKVAATLVASKKFLECPANTRR